MFAGIGIHRKVLKVRPSFCFKGKTFFSVFRFKTEHEFSDFRFEKKNYFFFVFRFKFKNCYMVFKNDFPIVFCFEYFKTIFSF